MTYYMVDISSSLPESHASRPHSELWSVMFFISHDFNPHDSNFRTVAFLAEWFVIFLFLHNSKLFIWLNIVFIVLKPIRWILIQMVVYCYKAQKSPLDHLVKSVQIRSYFWSVFGHFSSSGHCCDFFAQFSKINCGFKFSHWFVVCQLHQFQDKSVQSSDSSIYLSTLHTKVEIIVRSNCLDERWRRITA